MWNEFLGNQILISAAAYVPHILSVFPGEKLRLNSGYSQRKRYSTVLPVFRSPALRPSRRTLRSSREQS